jgi:hypothetical protein
MSKAAAVAQTGMEEEYPVAVAEAAGYVGNWEEVLPLEKKMMVVVVVVVVDQWLVL